MRFYVKTGEHRYSLVTIKDLEMHRDGGVERYVFDVKTWDQVTE